MYTHGLLAPMTILVAWTLLVMIWLYVTRLTSMRRLRVPPEAGRFARELNSLMPSGTREVADNYNHLMEQPTIFYAICIVLQLSGQGDHALNIGLAWGYVALRMIHSVIQCFLNLVPLRFSVFILASLLLAGLTVHALIGIFAAG